jgi:hypothetical protein
MRGPLEEIAMKVDAFKERLAAAFDNSKTQVRLLSRALGETEETLQALLDGELPEEEAAALEAKLAELLAPPVASPIPKARARRAAMRQLKGATKATEAAARSCRTGGGSVGYCARIDKSLAELADLQRELDDEPPEPEEQADQEEQDE